MSNMLIDAPPNSLKDSNVSPKVKKMEKEGVGVHFLIRNILPTSQKLSSLIFDLIFWFFEVWATSRPLSLSIFALVCASSQLHFLLPKSNCLEFLNPPRCLKELLWD